MPPTARGTRVRRISCGRWSGALTIEYGRMVTSGPCSPGRIRPARQYWPATKASIGASKLSENSESV